MDVYKNGSVRARIRALAVPGPWMRIALLAVLAAMLVAMAAGWAQMAFAQEDTETSNYSMYNMASVITGYVGNSFSPGAEKELEGAWRDMLNSSSSGGAVLGYADASITDGLLQWMTSKVSGSSDALSFDIFRSTRIDGETMVANGVLNYAYFGAALNSLGLDTTATSMGSNVVSKLIGGLTLVLYLISGVGVHALFYGIFTMLQWLNPFYWFYEGVAGYSETYAEGMTQGGQAPTVFVGLAGWISDWYQTLSTLSWAVMVPLFLGVLLITLVFYKRGTVNKGQKIKLFVVRVLFLGLGLSLLGSMYTSTLNTMINTMSPKNSGASRMVLSNFVDFENWVNVNRLAVPDCATIEWDSVRDQPTSAANTKLRESALCINLATDKYGNKISSADQGWGGSFAGGSTFDMGTGAIDDGGTIVAITDLLNRYSNAEQIDSADFETSIQGQINEDMKKNGGAKGQYDAWFKDFKDISGAEAAVPRGDDQGNVTNALIYNHGGLAGVRQGNGVGSVVVFSSTGTSQCNYRVVRDPSEMDAMDCNLSPLAMYNYLNTSFDSTSLTIYSSGKVASGATREAHMSVSMIGTGVVKIVTWLNTVTMMTAIATIGLAYGLGMLLGTVRRTTELITSVPFAMVGVIAGIAKVVVYVMAMVCEILVTVFLYVLIQEFLLTIPQIVEAPLNEFFKLLGGGGSTPVVPGTPGGPGMGAAGASWISWVGVLLVLGSIVAMTWALVRWREPIQRRIGSVSRTISSLAGAPDQPWSTPTITIARTA